jgi:hypothetical protein
LRDIVSVPHLLQRDVDWQTSTSKHRLTEAVIKILGAPHLDAHSQLLQDLLCDMAEAVGECRQQRDQALPDVETISRHAHRHAAGIHRFDLLELADEFHLGNRPLRCEVKDVEREVRQMLEEALGQLLLRAAKNPPRRKRNRAQVA